MFKLLAFFAILAAAFAAPQPAPGQRDARALIAATYSAGLPLTYPAAPIAYSNLGYSNLGYSYPAYASSYYYNAAHAPSYPLIF